MVVDKVKNGSGAFGYNAETGVYEDLMEAGIIDPTKVTRFALQNATSVSSLLLTTEAMIAEAPEKGGSDMPANASGWYGRRHGWYGRHGWHDVISHSTLVSRKVSTP